MTVIKDDNYIVVQGWMRTKLHLENTKLLVYAAIYSFSQDGVNEYTASVAWLADFIAKSERSVYRALDELEKLGYIECCKRNKDKGKTNTYKAYSLDEIVKRRGTDIVSYPPGEGADIMSYPSDIVSYPVCHDVSPKNNNINNNINKQVSKKEKDKQEYQERASVCASDLTCMTDEELQASYEALCLSVPQTPEGLDSILDECALYAEEFARRFDQAQNDLKTDKPSISSNKKKVTSYDDVLASYDFSENVVQRMKAFIQHCYAGKQIVSNERLCLLCDKLIDVAELYFDEDKRWISIRQINVINRAISGGYYDFLVK